MCVCAWAHECECSKAEILGSSGAGVEGIVSLLAVGAGVGTQVPWKICRFSSLLLSLKNVM